MAATRSGDLIAACLWIGLMACAAWGSAMLRLLLIIAAYIAAAIKAAA